VSDNLSQDEELQLVEVFDRAFGSASLPMPQRGETEPQYAARVLLPIAAEARDRLNVSGLTLAGEGAGTVVPTYLLSHRFFPDFAVSYFAKRLLAVEVKFLRESGRSTAIASALGQCLLYQLDRYPYARALLIDLRGRLSSSDLLHCHSLFSQSGGISVIHRPAR
jgi:hypothetical protein